MTTVTGPLKSLNILDFSTLLPGPYATMLMADMGATVLRVESPTRSDLLKNMPPLHGKNSFAHLSINRNKKSLALDLKNEDAKDIILKLIEEYDILIEQFRPGVMDKLGLGYSELSKINPRLIYCSITGYGQTGLYKDKAGHDINYLALSGLASYSGRKETGPCLSGTQIADLAGGSHHAVMSIQAAVISRAGSGKGQHLDISICDSALTLNSIFGASALASGQDPSYEDQLLNGGSYYDYYPTSDGRYLSLGALEPKFASIFFKAIDKPEWLEQTLQPANQQALKEEIKKVISGNSFQYWLDVFKDLDACVEPVLNIHEAIEHPVFSERKMILEIELKDGMPVQQIAPAVKFSEQRQKFTPARDLGEDSIKVLRSLGYPEQKVTELLNNHIIVDPSIESPAPNLLPE